MSIIDFHTHIFPDKIAEQALATLAEDSGEYVPRTDGTLKGLLTSMDHAGIGASVVANIATRPAQMLPIFDFCRHIAGDRAVPLISVHPGNSMAEVNTLFLRAADAGIKGVKLHPMYQGFFIDDRKMCPLYQLIEHFGFFVVFHTGYDIAFPGNTQADVERIEVIAREFKELTIVATHVGGWRQWERAGVLAKYGNVYTETSMTLTEMDDSAFVKALSAFDEDRVLFGSDSPWTDQKEMVDRTLRLGLPERKLEKLLELNARALLGIKAI
jgi:predicted TIM-barrel fold metal-dependent hydrolase